MALTTARLARRPVELVASGRSPVLDEIGGPPIGVEHLPVSDRRPARLLACELRVLCGSLDRDALGGYVIQPHRSAWRRLRDLEAETVLHCARRVERTFAGWRLPPGDSIHEQVERFLAGGAS